MAKVVILSNTDGYYALAKKSLNSLRKDNILKDEGCCLFSNGRMLMGLLLGTVA